MRDALAELGGDPKKVNPLVPVELVIDHSVIAEVSGRPDAYDENVDIEYRRNIERYQLLRWAQQGFDGFRVVPPGTGICHQVNLEYLSRVVFATDEETVRAYDSGRCDAYTTDASGLYAERLKLASPDDNMVLPEIISKEPLGPSVRKDDVQWFQIVQWMHYALVTAEELGVTQANVDEKLKSENPDIRRLLGVEGDFGKGLGLTNDWAYRIIKAVGNYGESFERNVGQGSPIKIQRGLNALWTKGGLQYAPPIR